MIELPILALLDRSRNGIIRVVFVAYNELEDLLTIPNQRSVVEIVDKPKSLVINSRVLSASLNQYGTQNLNLPVKLTFRHIQTSFGIQIIVQCYFVRKSLRVKNIHLDSTVQYNFLREWSLQSTVY
ncbi:latrophilin Cirl-like isoform X1 [Limulus polyphemus]|uniref:Latrophilin Cirl-like isoform X1 n=1 Tax=Limulus polyphemus TaxID=6850 RepID=A0ABM1S8S1_LIMPO|nr:latrophilin Cirl-like isoform X1 [Limulus polyphemus]